jgi:hypothetical protein
MAQLAPSMPAGFQACPLIAPPGAPLQLCAVVRLRADSVAGWFVPVRETFDARCFLGCLTDEAGTVLQWIEIAIQTEDFAIDGPEAVRSQWNNQLLDERWKNNCRAARCGAEASVITGPWEREPPLPSFFDVAARRFRPLIDEPSQQAWKLCNDDQLLTAQKLPTYSGSLFRYLHIRSADGQDLFLSVREDAPVNENTQILRDVLAERALTAWNSGGFLMQVYRFSSLSSDAFLDVLGGAKYDGLPVGKLPADFDGIAQVLRDTGESATSGTVFLGRHGLRGRMIESLHLKLKFLADAVHQTQTAVRALQRPILNLQCSSFQVAMANPAVALPFLWTGQVRLMDCGDAARLNVADAQVQVFTRGSKTSPGVYQPSVEARPMITEKAALRLRKVTAESDHSLYVEGTLSNLDAVAPRAEDLVCARFGLTDQRILIAGSVEQDSALAVGEYRFRSLRQAMPPRLIPLLKGAEGATLQPVGVQCVPRMDTAYDLYALAVLAVRTLVVHAANPLPVAVDELNSLARQLAVEHSSDKPLEERILDMLSRDHRWIKSLGPQNVFRTAGLQEQDSELIPMRLWADILSLMVQLIPAVGPDSFCRAYGTIPSAAMATVFEPVAERLQRLLIQTRSLIVIDWQVNREVHAVIRRFQLGIQ